MPLTDAQVIAAFGDPAPYVLQDGSIDSIWRTLILAPLELPAPLPLSWDRQHSVSRLMVHRRLVVPFRLALEAVHADAEAWASLGDTGGCYAWRARRGSKRPSRHGWAIAIDLDVLDNPDGAVSKMHPRVIAAFENNGFEWAGRWSKKERDPMHFEFVDLARLAA